MEVPKFRYTIDVQGHMGSLVMTMIKSRQYLDTKRPTIEA